MNIFQQMKADMPSQRIVLECFIDKGNLNSMCFDQYHRKAGQLMSSSYNIDKLALYLRMR